MGLNTDKCNKRPKRNTETESELLNNHMIYLILLFFSPGVKW